MKHKYFVMSFAALFCLCTALTLVSFSCRNAETAEIYVEGELYRSVNLSGVTKPYTIAIERDGLVNVVLIEEGTATMAEANCPDKLCIKQGAAKNTLYPIVCLPNEIVIKLTGVKADGEPDALSR